MAEFRYTTAGPGDACTWPPCAGHPNDPRTPDYAVEQEGCPECGADDWREDDDGGRTCAGCGGHVDD